MFRVQTFPGTQNGDIEDVDLVLKNRDRYTILVDLLKILDEFDPRCILVNFSLSDLHPELVNRPISYRGPSRLSVDRNSG